MTILEFDGVCKTLRRRGPDHVVLDDVSFLVEEGRLVGILGAPGSGKSMLLRIAAGQAVPDAGSVRFTGRDLYAMKVRHRDELLVDSIGWARYLKPPAGFGILSEFLAFSAPPKVERRCVRHEVAALLEAVGLAELAGASWRGLTAAEQRRAGLAHALIRRPRLVLADDPLLGSDVFHREQLQTLLRRYADQHGIAVLMATSDAVDLLGCDELMMLSDGSILRPSPRTSAEVIDFPRRESRSA